MTQTNSEHPFAEIIRILGKGKKGSRPLSQQQAYTAMQMILSEQVEPIQLGAFLMLMRVKEETAEELAGFALAAQQSFSLPKPTIQADLNWSSYAGKRRHLPWFILSALLLAENGVKVLMHGATGQSEERIYTEDALKTLGIQTAQSLQEAQQHIKLHRFSYLSLEYFCPKLHQILQLRPLLGLRSPVHSLVRLLNPLNAQYSIQGIFHPSYRATHQQAALLIKQPHLAVLKGEGGEIERNPDNSCLVQSVHQGQLMDEEWPKLFERRHLKPDTLNLNELIQLWRGEQDNEYAQATIIGTTAITLKLLGKVNDQQQAHALATSYWQQRNKNRYPI